MVKNTKKKIINIFEILLFAIALFVRILNPAFGSPVLYVNGLTETLHGSFLFNGEIKILFGPGTTFKGDVITVFSYSKFQVLFIISS